MRAIYSALFIEGVMEESLRMNARGECGAGAMVYAR